MFAGLAYSVLLKSLFMSIIVKELFTAWEQKRYEIIWIHKK